ncbi:hypothetical protein OJAV_G00134970 [Oryzias javanicus]|uniref:Ubiquitin carboxyl-terminal hydrolase MINDY n=1 Tax=Oryzias javanicus TaxID=123683 RepID=A0A3S2U8L7_ORYJA|nr:hypothetical protein OJAV_G00134970 [Oryzias javanicus]
MAAKTAAMVNTHKSREQQLVLKRWRRAEPGDPGLSRKRLLHVRNEEEPEEAPPPRRIPQTCSTPRRLAVSPGLGGKPLTPPFTENLRRLLFGRTVRVFNFDWRKSFFHFREPNSELSYALEVDQGGARAVQMVIQARIIKHLLFSQQGGSERRSLLSLTELGPQEQQGALAAALSDSLWLAGQEESATVTMVTEDDCAPPPSDYRLDLLTEKMQMFVFNRKEELSSFLLEHIHCSGLFQNHGQDPGRSGLFYCSSTPTQSGEVCMQPGFAQPPADRQSHSSRLQRRSGLLEGALLLWTPPCRGSDPWRCRLPALEPRADGPGPTASGGEHAEDPPVSSVALLQSTAPTRFLFSLTRSLLSDWRTEHQFQLFYYNGQNSQNSTARLSIDTHSHHWEAPSGDPGVDLEKRFPSLEMTIRTKWEGASISWGGVPPFY